MVFVIASDTVAGDTEVTVGDGVSAVNEDAATPLHPANSHPIRLTHNILKVVFRMVDGRFFPGPRLKTRQGDDYTLRLPMVDGLSSIVNGLLSIVRT
jgi:hypothetical protein